MGFNDSANPNGFYNNGNGWQNLQMPAYAQMPVRFYTNVEPVTSLEEAIIKSNLRGSDMFYIDQNKPVMYRVKVEFDGRKSYVQLPFNLPNQPDSVPATKADLQLLAEQIDKLASTLNSPAALPEKVGKKKKSEEVSTDESAG